MCNGKGTCSCEKSSNKSCESSKKSHKKSKKSHKKKNCSCGKQDDCCCAPQNSLLFELKAQIELKLYISNCYEVRGKFKFPLQVKICGEGCWQRLSHSEELSTQYAFDQCGVGPWLQVQTFIQQFATAGLTDKIAAIADAANEANTLFQQQLPLIPTQLPLLI
jgi:hypothetical protein